MTDCCDPPDLLFTCQDDIDTDQCIVQEFFYSHFRKHPYYIVDQSIAKNIYGEPAGDPEVAEVSPVYTVADPLFPFQIKLNPEEEELNKFGYDRTRDALVIFSFQLMRSISIAPKVGDRFDFVFTNESDLQVVEHFEILEISPVDFQRQTKVPTQIVAAADRTYKSKKP